MAISTSDAIFLGNFADADTVEGSYSIENTGVYLNTFGSSGSPLSDQIVTVTYDDSGNNGSIDTDNVGTETISVDVGAGPITANVDSLAVVTLTVTYSNGSSQSFSNAVMFQDSDGNLFLTNSNFAGTDLNGPNNLPIESVTINSISNSNYTGLYHNALQSFVCFAAGTLIRTPYGEQRIETLSPGDVITTQDNGAQPVRWLGVRRLAVTDKTRPIRIRAGALGGGLPLRDLLVSQQHRMLVRSKIAQRMFNTDEVLIPAKRFLTLEGIDLCDRAKTVTYAHLLLDRHEIIYANGAPSESLLPGPQALDMMGRQARAEVLAIFPELSKTDGLAGTARYVPEIPRQKQLCARHEKNRRRILDMA